MHKNKVAATRDQGGDEAKTANESGGKKHGIAFVIYLSLSFECVYNKISLIS